MRFNIAALACSVLAGTAIAAPAEIISRDVAISQNQMTEAIIFAAQADCSILKCASVIASSACIGAGIATGAVPAVLGCVATGASAVCGCAGCIKELGDFLTAHKVCD